MGIRTRSLSIRTCRCRSGTPDHVEVARADVRRMAPAAHDLTLPAGGCQSQRQPLLKEHRGVPGTVEVTASDLVKACSGVVDPQRSIGLHAVKAQVGATGGSRSALGPLEEREAEALADEAAVDDQAMDVCRVRWLRPPHEIVRPQQPQTCHDRMVTAYDEPLPVPDLAAHLLGGDLSGSTA